MKATNSNLQLIAVVLSIALSFQSCKVYRSETVTIDEALRFQKNIKVVSATNEIYKFKSFQKEEGKIYGIVKKSSKTAKKLANQTAEYNNPSLVKIHLLEANTKEIYLQNKSMTTVGNVFIVIGSLLAVLLSVFAIGGGVGIGSGTLGSLYY